MGERQEELSLGLIREKKPKKRKEKQQLFLKESNHKLPSFLAALPESRLCIPLRSASTLGLDPPLLLGSVGLGDLLISGSLRLQPGAELEHFYRLKEIHLY